MENNLVQEVFAEIRAGLAALAKEGYPATEILKLIAQEDPDAETALIDEQSPAPRSLYTDNSQYNGHGEAKEDSEKAEKPQKTGENCVKHSKTNTGNSLQRNDFMEPRRTAKYGKLETVTQTSTTNQYEALCDGSDEEQSENQQTTENEEKSENRNEETKIQEREKNTEKIPPLIIREKTKWSQWKKKNLKIVIKGIKTEKNEDEIKGDLQYQGYPVVDKNPLQTLQSIRELSLVQLAKRKRHFIV